MKTYKKDILAKISVYISKKLNQIREEKIYTDVEIMKLIGWHNTRLSELRNYKKYEKPIPEQYLIALIQNGILSINEILNNVNLSEQEIKYITNLKIYEILYLYPDLQNVLIKCDEKKINPVTVLENYLENNN